MGRIQVEVAGLTASPHNSGAYALILQEVNGARRLSIVIGQDQAQSIVLQLQEMKPVRPVSHDLLKSVIEALGGRVLEVTVNDLRDSTFYAAVRIDGASDEVDARPSDAIALAIRSGAPIYVEESVLHEAGMMEQEEQEDETGMEDAEESQEEEDEPASSSGGTQSHGAKSQRELLQERLDDAVRNEDYENAILIREQLDSLDKAG